MVDAVLSTYMGEFELGKIVVPSELAETLIMRIKEGRTEPATAHRVESIPALSPIQGSSVMLVQPLAKLGPLRGLNRGHSFRSVP